VTASLASLIHRLTVPTSEVAGSCARYFGRFFLDRLRFQRHRQLNNRFRNRQLGDGWLSCAVALSCGMFRFLN